MHDHRRRSRSGWTSGGTHGERRRWVRAEWGGIWGGVSPPQPTKRSGGASWAPSAGSGAESRPKTDFGVFWRPQNTHFCTYDKIWGEQFVLASTALNSGGTWPPPLFPPWSTPMCTTHKTVQNFTSGHTGHNLSNIPSMHCCYAARYPGVRTNLPRTNATQTDIPDSPSPWTPVLPKKGPTPG